MIVKKKKKQKKRRTQSAPTLTVQENEHIKAILHDLTQINKDNLNDIITSPVFARILVERLPIEAPETPDLILLIKKFYNHKDVQKAIKKVIFRLRQKGIHIDDPTAQTDARPIFGKIEKEKPTAYLSPIDGTGSRGVMVVIPQIPKGVDVGIGVISYENGIVNFIANTSSKKQTREIKDFFFEQAGKPVETSLSHAATLLEEAYKDTSSEGVEGYLQIRPKILNNTTLIDRPIIYDLIDLDEFSGQRLTDSQTRKLLDHDLIKTWIISPDKIKPLLEEVSEAENSPIMISEDQKASRINEIKIKAILDIYPETKRLELKSMLEEMSYVLFKLDDEDYAQLALVAALSLDEEITQLRVNSLLNALLEQSLKFYKDIVETEGELLDKENDSQSNIIIP